MAPKRKIASDATVAQGGPNTAPTIEQPSLEEVYPSAAASGPRTSSPTPSQQPSAATAPEQPTIHMGQSGFECTVVVLTAVEVDSLTLKVQFGSEKEFSLEMRPADYGQLRGRVWIQDGVPAAKHKELKYLATAWIHGKEHDQNRAGVHKFYEFGFLNHPLVTIYIPDKFGGMIWNTIIKSSSTSFGELFRCALIAARHTTHSIRDLIDTAKEIAWQHVHRDFSINLLALVESLQSKFPSLFPTASAAVAGGLVLFTACKAEFGTTKVRFSYVLEVAAQFRTNVSPFEVAEPLLSLQRQTTLLPSSIKRTLAEIISRPSIEEDGSASSAAKRFFELVSAGFAFLADNKILPPRPGDLQLSPVEAGELEAFIPEMHVELFKRSVTTVRKLQKAQAKVPALGVDLLIDNLERLRDRGREEFEADLRDFHALLCSAERTPRLAKFWLTHEQYSFESVRRARSDTTRSHAEVLDFAAWSVVAACRDALHEDREWPTKFRRLVWERMRCAAEKALAAELTDLGKMRQRHVVRAKIATLGFDLRDADHYCPILRLPAAVTDDAFEERLSLCLEPTGAGATEWISVDQLEAERAEVTKILEGSQRPGELQRWATRLKQLSAAAPPFFVDVIVNRLAMEFTGEVLNATRLSADEERLAQGLWPEQQPLSSVVGVALKLCQRPQTREKLREYVDVYATLRQAGLDGVGGDPRLQELAKLQDRLPHLLGDLAERATSLLLTAQQWEELKRLDVVRGLKEAAALFHPPHVRFDVERTDREATTIIERATGSLTKRIELLRRHFEQHAPFAAAAAAAIGRLQGDLDRLAQTRVSDLRRHAGHFSVLGAVADELQRHLRSAVFKVFWRRVASRGGDSFVEVPEDADESAFCEAAREALHRALIDFEGLWTRISDGNITTFADATDLVSTPGFPVQREQPHDALQRTPEVLRAEAVARAAELHDERDRWLREQIAFAKDLLQHTRVVLNAEKVVPLVLGALRTEATLSAFLAFVRIADHLGAPVQPGSLAQRAAALQEQLARRSSATRTVAAAVGLMSEIHAAFPDLSDTFAGFLESFATLVVDEHLDRSVAHDSEVRQLAVLVLRRLEVITDERDAQTLSAYQVVVETLASSPRDFTALCGGSANGPVELCRYLCSVSGCAPYAQQLLHRVRELARLKRDDDDEQAIVVVNRLLTRGVFRIDYDEDNHARVRAKVDDSDDGEGRQRRKIYEWHELSEFGAQLALAAHIDVDDDEEEEEDNAANGQRHGERAGVAGRSGDVGGHFGIRTVEERRQLILLYEDLRDGLQELLVCFDELATCGHPQHRAERSSIVLPVQGNVAEVTHRIAEIAVELQEMSLWWVKEFLQTATARMPLLSFMSRLLLADCIVCLLNNDKAGFEGTIARLVVANEGQSFQPVTPERWLEVRQRDDDEDNGGGGQRRRRRGGVGAESHGAAGADREQYMRFCHLINEVLCSNLRASIPRALLAATDNRSMPVAALGNAPFTVLRAADGDGGEEADLMAYASLLYVGALRRLPASFEVLICTAATTEVELADFVQRWRINHERIFSGTPLLFSLCNAERLPTELTHWLVATLREVARTAREKHTRLAVLCGGDCLLARSLPEHAGPVIGLRGNTDFEAHMARCYAKLRVTVVSTARPMQGKTRWIHAQAAAAAPGTLYAMLPISSTSTLSSLCASLSALSDEASAQGNPSVFLHFDLAPDIDAGFVNRFLFELLVLRSVTDRSGRIVRLPHSFTVFVEVASDLTAVRAPLLRFFSAAAVPGLVRVSKFEVTPQLRPGDDEAAAAAAGAVAGAIDVPLLCRVTEREDPLLALGARALAHFTSADVVQAKRMSDGRGIAALPLPDAQVLTERVTSLVRDAAARDDLGTVFRFFTFAAVQCAYLLQGGNMFEDIIVSFDHESEHQNRGMRTLLFHYVELIVVIANNMAAASIPPRSSHDEGDDTRFARMTHFNEWREHPLLAVNRTDFRLLSLSCNGANAFSDIIARNPDRHFHMFMQGQQAKAPLDRARLADKCAAVADLKTLDTGNSDSPLPLILSLCSVHADIMRRAFATLDGIAQDDRIDTRKFVVTLRERFAIDDCIAVLNSSGNRAIEAESTRISDFVHELRAWLQSIFGSSLDAHQPPFVMTVDLLIRIVSMKLRAVCGLPVVWVGESGCGKTHAVQAFCSAAAAGCHVININGSMTAEDLLAQLGPAMRDALEHASKTVVVQLDEFNTLRDMWCIKQLVVDHTILGHRVPRNISFVAIMNPVRFRTPAQIEAMEKVDRLGGLNYAMYDDGAAGSAASGVQQERRLVYQVSRTPESMMRLAWDFGSCVDNHSSAVDVSKRINGRTRMHELGAEVSDEVVFAENIINWMTKHELRQFHRVKLGVVEVGLDVDFGRARDRDGVCNMIAFRTIVCAMLKVSQEFVRGVFGGEPSVVSLRDMRRVAKLIPFFMQCFVERARITGLDAREMPFFDFLTRATCTAFVMVYCLRLEREQRKQYLIKLHTTWTACRQRLAKGALTDTAQAGQQGLMHTAFFQPPGEPNQIYECGFDFLAQYCCSCLPDGDGLAINEALKENTLSMFAAFMTDQALMIVGRAGSSKSRSKDSLINATDPYSGDTRAAFFRSFDVKLLKFVLQCSRHTTAQDVLRVATNAARQQRKAPGVKCVLVLEEVGVTLGSKHNPLMMLHTLIDHGVPLIHDGVKVAVKIPILGISNWQLDASKMNRAITTHRGNPPEHDLLETANRLLSRHTLYGLERFVQTFSDSVLTNDRRTPFTWFHGMRDFYNFLTTIADFQSGRLSVDGSHEPGAGKLAPHAIRWALRIAFGGMPAKFAEEERELLDKMQQNLCGSDARGRPDTACNARYTVRQEGSGRELRLCEHCAMMRFNLMWMQQQNRDPNSFRRPDETDDEWVARRSQWRPRDPDESEGDFAARRSRHFRKVTALVTQQFPCEFFDDATRRGGDTEVMAFSLTHLSSRHQLLFTHDNHAVQLLEGVGLIHRSPESTTIIFGTSATAAAQSTRVGDLSKVKSRLRRGGTLVLVNAAHLYEALLDPLNLSYSKEVRGGKATFRTRLPTADGFSQEVRVDPSFRCIIVANEDTADKLLPPFLNRFMKARISYSQVLTPAQSELCQLIRSEAQLVHGGAARSLLSLAVPSFGGETVASAVIMAAEEEEARRRAEMGDEHYKTGISAHRALGYCIAPLALERLRAGVDDTPNNAAAFAAWEQHMLNVDLEVRRHDFADDLFTAWAEQGDCSHFVVMTSQRTIDNAAVVARAMELMQRSYADGGETDVGITHVSAGPQAPVLEIDAPGADVTATRMLREMTQGTGPESKLVKFAVFFADATVPSSSLNRLVFNITARVQQGQRCHAIIILYIPDAMPCDDGAVVPAAANGFALTLTRGWVQLFLDEVTPSPPLSVLSHSDFHKRDLFAGDLDHAALGRQMLTQSAVAIAQHYARGDAPPNATDFLRRAFSSPAGICLVEHCVEQLRRVECFRNGAWRSLALHHVSEASSLRGVTNLFLQAVWTRCGVKLLPVLQRELLEFQGDAALQIRVLQHVLLPLLGPFDDVVDVQLPLSAPTASNPLQHALSVAGAHLRSRTDDGDKGSRFPLVQLIAGVLHSNSDVPIARRACHHREVAPGLFNTDNFTDAERRHFARDVVALATSCARADSAEAALRLLEAVVQPPRDTDAVTVVLHALVAERQLLEAAVAVLQACPHVRELLLQNSDAAPSAALTRCVFARAALQTPASDMRIFGFVKLIAKRLQQHDALDADEQDAVNWAAEECAMMAEGAEARVAIHQCVVRARGDPAGALEAALQAVSAGGCVGRSPAHRALCHVLIDTAVSRLQREGHTATPLLLAALQQLSPDSSGPLRHRLCVALMHQWIAEGAHSFDIPQQLEPAVAEAMFRVLTAPPSALGGARSSGPSLLGDILQFHTTELAAEGGGRQSSMHRCSRVASLSAAVAIIAATVSERGGARHSCSFPVLRLEPEGELRALVGSVDAAIDAIAPASERAVLQSEVALSLLRQLSGGGLELSRALDLLNRSASDLPRCIMRASPIDEFRAMMHNAQRERLPVLACIEGWRSCTDALALADEAACRAALEPHTTLARLAALRSALLRGGPAATRAGAVMGAEQPPAAAMLSCAAITGVDEDLAVHCAAAFAAAKGGPLSFYGALLRGFDGSMLLPTVTDCADLDYVRVALTTMGNAGAHLWRCPNGHPYATQGCEHMAVNRGVRCPRRGCGAQIGAQAHAQPYPGNVRLGPLQSFVNYNDFPKTTGYHTTVAAADVTLPRGMKPAAFYACRFFLLVALVHSAELHRARHAHSREEYLLDLREAFASLRNALFPAAGSDALVAEWLHAVLDALWREGAVTGAGPLLPAARTPARDAVERFFNENVTSPEQAGALLAAFRARQRANSEAEDVLASALRFDAAHVARVAAAGPPEQELERRHFCFRAPFDVEHFVGASAARLPLTSQVLRLGGLLSEEEATTTCALVAFVSTLTATCEKLRVTRKMARCTTLNDFFKEHDSRELQLESKFHALRDAMLLQRDPRLKRLKRLGCVPVPESFPPDVLELNSLSTPLSFLLPDNADDGLFAQALFAGEDGDGAPATLPVAQNALIGLVRARQSATTATQAAARNAYSIRREELLQLAVLGDQNCGGGGDGAAQAFVLGCVQQGLVDYLAAPGRPAVADAELDAMEARVAAALQIATAPLLPLRLPAFAYAGSEEEFAQFVGEVEARTGAGAMPPHAVLQLFAELRGVVHLRPGLFSLLMLLCTTQLRALQRRADDPAFFPRNTPIMDITVGVPLTDAQQRARAVLQGSQFALSSCFVEHLPVITALVWSGEVVAAAREAPQDPLAFGAVLEAGLDAMDADEQLRGERLRLLAALCVTGLSQCTRPETVYPDQLVLDAAENATMVADVDRLGGSGNNPLVTAAVPTRHFKFLLDAMERRWGPLLLAGAAGAAAPGSGNEGPALSRLALRIRQVFRAPAAAADHGTAGGENSGDGDSVHLHAQVTPRFTPRSARPRAQQRTRTDAPAPKTIQWNQKAW